ncbi:hypothetical protein RDV78_10590 [Bacillota bacterium LX-D]|nr:hypothetical protein [Bacillota bacterium LX-D]
MLTKDMGAIKVKAMQQYIPIKQKRKTREIVNNVKEPLNYYPTVESYLEEVVNPIKDDK